MYDLNVSPLVRAAWNLWKIDVVRFGISGELGGEWGVDLVGGEASSSSSPTTRASDTLPTNSPSPEGCGV